MTILYVLAELVLAMSLSHASYHLPSSLSVVKQVIWMIYSCIPFFYEGLPAFVFWYKHLPSCFCSCSTWAHLFISGASDDAVSCAVMLEVLHSLANQSTPLHHGVVFLFNGAEENVLQVKWSTRVAKLGTNSNLFGRVLSFLSQLSLSFPLVNYFFYCRPVMVLLPSIPGPNKFVLSLTWRLQALAARKLFSRQVWKDSYLRTWWFSSSLWSVWNIHAYICAALSLF